MTKIKIIPVDKWTDGKSDPTEYSYDADTIRVRSDYDYKNDPYSMLVHEKAHAEIANAEKTRTLKEPNTAGYPANTHERYAFGKQFADLKRKGYTFEDLKNGKIPGLEHKQGYLSILKKYWDADEPQLDDFFENSKKEKKSTVKEILGLIK